MRPRPADPALMARALARAHRAVVRDAAAIAAVPLVELLVARPDAEGRPAWESVAFAAPHLGRTARAELARTLARSPAAAELPSQRRAAVHRVASCEAALARVLGGRGLQQVFVPVSPSHAPCGWLRLVREGRPDRHALQTYRALARQVAGRLDAEALRRGLAARHRAVERDVEREKRALADLAEAKDTLGALNLAGAHLMVETDGAVISSVICRELLRLGFHSAVLTAERDLAGPRPPYRFTSSSFPPALQAATERLLGRPLSEIRVDPATAPLLSRALRHGRTVSTGRARAAARQLFGASAPLQVRKLARLLRLERILLAPLRYGEGVSGLLVVATDRTRRGDVDAIDAFALQASIALEKARLFGELRANEARLESEVERRTRELTRAVRALRELDRRKDNFLANISHELRTPLVTVLGYTDLLLSEKLGELSEREREALQVVQTSGRRLRSFIEELLDFSRHELTRDQLRFAPVAVGELLHQAVLALAPRFHERGVLVRARVERGTPDAWGDRDKLLQVIMNLLSNAERHSRPGGHVHVCAARGGPGRVDLSVTDDGEGIPEEHLAHIFDRLYQVGDALKQREKGAGLGLGLTIAKSIVMAHGGQISVRSRVGHGSRFRMALPTVEGARVGRRLPAEDPVQTPLPGP